MLASYGKDGFGGLLVSLKELKISGKDVTDFFENDFSMGMIKTTNDVRGLANAHGVGKKSVVQYFSALKDGSVTVEKGQTALQGYQSYLQSTGRATDLANIKTKALTVSMKVFSTIGWMAIMSIAMKAIGKGIELIDDLANASEKCAERVDTLMSSFKSSLDAANSNANKTEELAAKYESLSKGVNKLGENVSLTTDEYTEYNNIVNDIADMFPTLISGYTDEGNAILSLKGNVEKLRDAYKETQQEAYNMLITSGEDTDGNDIISNWENLHDTNFFSKMFDYGTGTIEVGKGISAVDAIEQLKELQNMTIETYRNIESTLYNGAYSEFEALTDIQKDIVSGSYIKDTLGIDILVSDEDFENAKTQAKALVQTYQAEIDSALKSVQSLANAYLMTNDDYSTLDAQTQAIASQIVNTINAGIASGFEDKTDVGEHVQGILDVIKDNPLAKNAMLGLFTTDLTEMSPDKAKEIVDQYINKIAEVLDEDALELKVRLGFDDTDDLATKYKNAIKSAQDKFGTDETDFFTKNSINTTVEIDDWLECAKAANSAADAKQRYLNIGNDSNTSPTLSLSSTMDQLNTQLKPTFDSLKSAYQDIFTEDGFTLENVDLSMLDSIKSSLDDMGEELKIDVDYSEYENLVKVLTDSSSTADEVQQSMNTLAQSVLNNTSVLQNFNGESYKTVQTMLETLGVANSESVMLAALGYSYEEYTAAKVECTDAGFDLANATDVEIAKFIEEQGGADNCGVALANLQLKKILVNSTQITTATDIAQILSLAKAANISSQSLVALAAAKEQFETASANGDKMGMSLAARGLTEIGEKVKNDLLNYEPVAVDFAPTSKKSASKAGKETADAYLEAYKKELAELEHIHEMGIISDKDYYNQLDGLNEKYFNDSAEHQKKYLDEYQANQEKVYKGLQSLYKELLNDQKDGYDSALRAIDKHFDGEIDKLNELKDTSKESYESQIKDIDKKIDRLEKERDERKKSVQDQIDAIKDENKALEFQKELEKALYDQKYAQTQKSLTYQTVDENGGQTVYKTNSKEITEKTDKVDEVLDDIKLAELEKELKSIDEYYDNLISNLESQQDALQEKMDSVTASYEQQIKQMEANQQKYADIATAQKDAEDKMMATSLIGSNWQQLVLSGRLDVLDAFKGNYLGICGEINNADATFGLDASTAAEGYAQSISDMLTRTTSLETLLQSWKDLNTGLGGVIGVGGSSSEISTEQGGNTGNGQTASGPNKTPSSGASDTITGAVQGGGDQIADTLANQWVPAWQDVGNNMNDICGGIVSCVNEMASSVVDACAQAIEAINKANAAKDSSSSSNATPSFSSPSYGGKAFAHGTDTTIKGNGSALVNELGEEGLIRNGELHKIHGGAQYMGVKDGDIILNHKQMGELEKNKKVTSNGGRGKLVGSFANGTQTNTGVNQEALEALLNDLGKTDENGNIRIKSLENPVLTEQMKNLTKVYNPSDMIMQNFVPKIPDYSNVATERSQEVTISIGDIKLEGVQDADGLAREIINQLPNKVIQKMYAK